MSSRPHVLLVHYTFPSVPGGVEQVMARHARALVEAGAQVTIAAGRGRVAIEGVRAERIPELDSRHPAVLRVFRALARGAVPDELARVRERLRARLLPLARGVDRMVAHNVATLHKNAPLTAALHDIGPRLESGRLVVWVHDLAWADPRYAAQRHLGAPWDLFVTPIPRARYVAVSEARREETARLLGVAASSITVVPNGVDADQLLRLAPATRALAERLNLLDADPLLLLPARLTRRKRVEVAIGAAAELRRRGRRALLVVTGAPGPHNPENAAYLEELRVDVRRARGAAILLHDAIGERLPYRTLADLYALADALVFPSESEGFGIPLLEAALARVPIVCSDIPAHRAIAGDDATYVGAAADARALADAIERALSGDRASRLRARARAEYGWPRILRERVIPLVLGAEAAR